MSLNVRSLSSGSTTQLEDQQLAASAPTRVISFTLHQSLQSQLNEQFKRLYQLGVGSDTEFTRLLEYADRYTEAKRCKHPSTADLGFKLSIALAFLILDAIQPAILLEDERTDELMEIEDEFKNVIKELLQIPDADLFLDQVQASDDKRKQMEQSLKQVELFFINLLKSIVAKAQTTDRIINDSFEQIKNILKTLNANQMHLAAHLHERLDRLNKEVENALLTFGNQTQEASELQTKMQEALERQIQLATSLEETLNKV